MTAVFLLLVFAVSEIKLKALCVSSITETQARTYYLKASSSVFLKSHHLSSSAGLSSPLSEFTLGQHWDAPVSHRAAPLHLPFNFISISKFLKHLLCLHCLCSSDLHTPDASLNAYYFHLCVSMLLATPSFSSKDKTESMQKRSSASQSWKSTTLARSGWPLNFLPMKSYNSACYSRWSIYKM